jgi:iron-sulfur cluster repair protein YtfE (RIC family)
MKRNSNLVLLSHDHYNGLVLANLLKKGAPVFNRLPNDIPGKLKFTLESYDRDIEKHFTEEEEILFPAVEGKDTETDILIENVLEEHCRMRELISNLRMGKDIEENLYKFGALLEKHIRKEERVLFRKIEEVLTEEELGNLGEKLVASQKRL